MIAQDRLCLTSDRLRVVKHGHPEAAFTLVAPGSIIPTQYEEAVRLFYASKQEAKTAGPVQQIKAIEPRQSAPMSADDSEGYETRIPKVLRRRGRPRKSEAFTGDGPGD